MGDDIRDRVDAVMRRVEEACRRAGRDPSTVRIVAVAKKFGPEAVRQVAECGLTVIGENRVQEARQKIPLCPGSLEWHLVGHLQTNKVRLAVGLFSMIHSIDSLRLLDAVDRECTDAGKTMPVLLEVNVSGERSKFGLAPESVPEVLQAAESLVHVTVQGLMTIPPVEEDPEEARPLFGALRAHRDTWREQFGIALDELSMGMSHDLEVAIEEGATLVRVGTALFGTRSAPAQGEKRSVEESHG